jgi:hypothetical protein
LTGIVRKNVKEMSKFTEKLDKGHTEAQHTDDKQVGMCMLSMLHEKVTKPMGKLKD